VLFTTAGFAFVFLPVALVGFFFIARFSRTAAATWLFAASVFFYGYWMPQYTLLLLTSIVVNFLVGTKISSAPRAPANEHSRAKYWLIVGVVFNLALLGYFKYANFFVDSLSAVLGRPLHVERILLPIGISFFTFTQIAFLSDAYQKGLREYKFAHYGLFVSYFPHLVAGPVLHHSQMMPQFQRDTTYRFELANFAPGMAIFCIGLIKKIVLADGISPYADAVFNAVTAGGLPTTDEAWLGALAYTMQLYFDFSGYSDMAIGLSWMFNILLPFNFNSPYRARNISDFWRRWHMTLSAFLRDYLYIPLGGNRHGPVRRYVNLGTTMLLGGLWHGASWTFVFWGGLHGLYLGVSHVFRAFSGGAVPWLERSRLSAVAGWLITMLAVIVAWVFFRAPTFADAARILEAMAHVPRPLAPEAQQMLWNAGLEGTVGWLACAVLGAMAVFGPNSNAIGEHIHRITLERPASRTFLLGFALPLVIFLVVLNESRGSVSAFIYFNF
jgi:alginate O-acetyltransferase complex protein AlgI